MSDSPVILSWNFSNWITVVLMVLIGVGAIKILHSAAAKFASANS